MPHPSPLDFPATVARRPKRQATDAVEFYGTVADHWSHTQVRDWIMLHPGLTRTAFRLYCLLRSMVSEKRPGPLRRMTLDQVCYLLPGVNGKGTSLTAVKDALRLLGSLGLVTTAEERVVTSSGRGGIHSTLRRYQVNDLPPHAYDGWRNAWDKLDSYQPDWRTNPPTPAPPRPVGGSPESVVGRNSDARTDLGRRQETAGRIDGRISDADGRKSDHASRISDRHEALTCENEAPKEVSLRSSSLSPAPWARHGAPVATETTRERPADSDHQDAAERIADAWAAGGRAGGGTPLPRRQASLRAQALELLTAGGQDVGFLLARAHWMGQAKPTWQRFEDALTYQGDGAPPRLAMVAAPRRSPRCGNCDDGWRYQDPDNALGPYRCPDCATLS